MKEQANIFHYDHKRFLVESRSRKGEMHMVEFFDRDNKFPEVCSCENFQLGIPHMVAEGTIPDTVEHRRCWHIRAVRDQLASAMIAHLVETDPTEMVFERKEPELVLERVKK